MIAVVIGTVVGIVVGAVVSGAVIRIGSRRSACPDPEVHGLSALDREAVSAEFAVHVSSVRRELSRYADALADGDVRLREQLRRFEAGAPS